MKLIFGAALVLAAQIASAQAVMKTVCSSGCDYSYTRNGFQQALNDAAAYQNNTACVPYIIQGDAGTIPGSSYVLPAKSCAQYVTIRTRRLDALPPDGTRVDPSIHEPFLLHFQGDDNSGSGQLFATAPNTLTRYWRFEGVEMDQVPITTFYYFYVLWGNVTDPNLRPDHLEIKHSYLHGDPAGNTIRGLLADGDSVRVLDSVLNQFTDFHDLLSRADTQAVLIAITSGPVELINNTLSAAGETTLIGGSLMPAGILPSFLYFIGNHYTKDPNFNFTQASGVPTWPCREGYTHRDTNTNHDWICSNAGTWQDQGGLTDHGPALVKNVFECKTCRGVRIFGNDFSPQWYEQAGGQNPAFLIFNLTSQNNTVDKLENWTAITDVQIWNNVMHNGQGFLTLGYPGGLGTACDAPIPTTPCFNVGFNKFRVHDNLAYNLADERDYCMEDTCGLSSVGQLDLNLSARDIVFEHNTFLKSTFSANSNRITASGNNNATQPNSYFGNIFFRDNILPIGLYGFVDAGIGSGSSACAIIQPLAISGGWDLRNNIFTQDVAGWKDFSSGQTDRSTCPQDSRWPSGNQAAPSGGAVVDEASPTYKVLAAYRGAATNGRDPGADIDAVNAATAGALTGGFNPYLAMRIRSVLPSGTTATIYYTAYSASTVCTVDVAPNNQYSPISGSVTGAQTGRDGRADITGLAANSLYFARLDCGGYLMETVFRTGP